MQTQPSPSRFALCADDFGLSSAVNDGILDLIRSSRVRCTSVLSQGPAWPGGAGALRELRGTTEVGLHLNLTRRFDGARTIRPLSWWLFAAPLELVDTKPLRAAFISQIEPFTRHFGRLPDFVDGHHHVHALPILRDVLTEVIAECWRGMRRPWVRAPDCLLDQGGSPLKSWIVRQATDGFADHVENAGLRCTRHLGGIYSPGPGTSFAQRMRGWLHQLPGETLIVVHPGRERRDPLAPSAARRFEQYQYLSDHRLSDDCASANASLVRFCDIMP